MENHSQIGLGQQGYLRFYPKGGVGPDPLTLWMARAVYTCTLFVKEVTHTFANSHHCNVKVIPSCNVASHGLIGGFLKI